MNAQNADKYLPLVQALIDGKILQEDYWGEWSDLTKEVSFDMQPEFYRVKPEPRMFDLWLDSDTGCMLTLEFIESLGHSNIDKLERITVQEVMK